MPWNEPPHSSASLPARENARRLRRAMTEPEKRLWWHLRHRLPQEGTHFRRQVALQRYVVDFCCLSARLIVEVDGDQHGHEAALAYDAHRTAILESAGFRVPRFTNSEVRHAIDSVLETILAALATHPLESSPRGTSAAET
ncbi:DUF559 domain-containing protein [uncultured Methylobacterium sp.]|uniref:endonuclease domain-containing protein n=1 Tax=uncultured Methylobacterium sp. TaxID=157278 RepID=UPI00262C6CAE|nr:DUF559 domain-containing protein [uncultured Methylobacterium sp.]